MTGFRLRSGQVVALLLALLAVSVSLSLIAWRIYADPEDLKDNFETGHLAAAAAAVDQAFRDENLDNLDPDRIAQIISTIQGPLAEIMVYDLTGEMIYSTFPAGESAHRSLPLTNSPQPLGPTGELTQYFTFDERDYRLLAKPLGPDNKPIGFYAVAIPTTVNSPVE